jgi:hypothetical protein
MVSTQHDDEIQRFRIETDSVHEFRFETDGGSQLWIYAEVTQTISTPCRINWPS